MLSPRIWLPLLAALSACTTDAPETRPDPADDAERATIPQQPLVIRAGRPVEPLAGETHLRNVRQLTFGGENAEAYWSFDGRKLVFQSTRPPEIPADQIFVLDLETGEERMVSTGKGRTTCAYFLLGDERIVYASTHLAGDEPPAARRVIDGNYVWPVFPSYDLFSVKVDGTDLRRLTDAPGYDAEATVCPVTGRMVFTSTRDDDLELYTMEPDGSDVQRITDRYGYDGGAFFSHDGEKIVQRSGFFADDAARQNYTRLLENDYVMPSAMELTILSRDGSDFRKVTDNGKANFAPFWHPDNEHIIFASDMDAEDGRDFELYLIHEDGSDLERITHNPSFDGFPMFSPDGRHLVFCSNRYGSTPHETNVFIAEWQD